MFYYYTKKQILLPSLYLGEEELITDTILHNVPHYEKEAKFKHPSYCHSTCQQRLSLFSAMPLRPSLNSCL